jgi:imidazolonepropionase-like amidohydrolase
VENSRKLIQARWVYPAMGDTVIENGVVVVEGSDIADVGEKSAILGQDDDSNAIEFSGTILPGLVDAHCHLTLAGDGRTYEEMNLDSDSMLALTAVRNLRTHLESGVTTLRDNGGRNTVTFDVRTAFRRGYLGTGPRMLLSGRPLTHTYGHFFWCNGVADGEDEIRATVRKLVAEGADHIKIMASGGATAGNIPYYASYTTQELAAAVAAAHELGRLTTAHCRARTSMEYALDARLDCIEHAEFLVPGEMQTYPSGSGIPASGVMEFDKDLARRIVDSDVYVGFTFAAGGYDSLVALRRIEERQGLSEEQEATKTALKEYIKIKSGIFSGLVDVGMLPRLVVSTDAGPYDIEFGRLHYGVELAVNAGLSHAQAIQAVTRIPAEACGLGSVVGTIEPGKAADLVIVDGNPLEDVTALQRILGVFVGGELVAGEKALV